MNNPSIFQLNSLSQIQPLFLVPVCRFESGFLPYLKRIEWRITSGHSQSFSCTNFYCYEETKKGRGKRRSVVAKASTRESPYQVLGVSPSATPDEIKRAYRRLALKFHPDVNKEANAQEKFMRIKHAYNILLNKSERQAESSYSTPGRSQSRTSEDDEEFYGFGNFVRDVQITIGDFFKDLQEEFRNWEAEAASQGKPKSLWEELSEIGEDFVEFLEKELNISDVDTEGTDDQKRNASSGGSKAAGRVSETDAAGRGKEENIVDDIEATLAQLKKELGL